MSIEDVLSEERKVLNSEIDELKSKVKNWIVGIMEDVKSDRKECPELTKCSFEEDVADNIIQTLIDWEFEQLDMLNQLSEKLSQFYDQIADDKRFGRHIDRSKL